MCSQWQRQWRTTNKLPIVRWKAPGSHKCLHMGMVDNAKFDTQKVAIVWCKGALQGLQSPTGLWTLSLCFVSLPWGLSLRPPACQPGFADKRSTRSTSSSLYRALQIKQGPDCFLLSRQSVAMSVGSCQGVLMVVRVCACITFSFVIAHLRSCLAKTHWHSDGVCWYLDTWTNMTLISGSAWRKKP